MFFGLIIMLTNKKIRNEFVQNAPLNKENRQNKNSQRHQNSFHILQKKPLSIDPHRRIFRFPASPEPSFPFISAPRRPPNRHFHPLKFHRSQVHKKPPVCREFHYLFGYKSPSERLSEIRSTYFKGNLNRREFQEVFTPDVVKVLNRLVFLVLDLKLHISMDVFSRFMTILHCYLCRVKAQFGQVKLLRTSFVCLWLSLKFWQNGLYLDKLLSVLESILPGRPRISALEFKQEELEIYSKLGFDICFRSHYDKISGYIHQMFSMDIEFAEDRRTRLAKNKRNASNEDLLKSNLWASRSLEKRWNLSGCKKLWKLHLDLEKFQFLKTQLVKWVDFYLKLVYLDPEFIVNCSQMLPLACIFCAILMLESSILEEAKRSYLSCNVLGKRERMEISSDSTYTDFRPVRSSFRNDSVKFLNKRFKVLLKTFKKFKVDFGELKKLVRRIQDFRVQSRRKKRFECFFQNHFEKLI